MGFFDKLIDFSTNTIDKIVDYDLLKRSGGGFGSGRDVPIIVQVDSGQLSATAQGNNGLILGMTQNQLIGLGVGGLVAFLILKAL